MTQLLETVRSPSVKVDKEAAIVRGAKFFGLESANARTYSDGAANDVRKLIESVVINLDHPDRKEAGRERGIMEGFAVPMNPERRPDGIYGDIQCIKAHPSTAVFLEWAERFPDKLGFSINAEGTIGKQKIGGKAVVESVTSLRSLDLVRNPATTKGLFESKEKTVSKTFKQILEANFPKTAKGCTLLENAAMGAMEVEVAEGADGPAEVKAAFKAASDSIMEGSATTKEAAKKLNSLVESFDKLAAVEIPKTPVTGNENLLEEINKLKADAACRDLLESEGIKSNPLRLKVLSALSDDERAEQVKEWKSATEQATPARPRTATPLYESRDGGKPSGIPTSAKEFAATAF